MQRDRFALRAGVEAVVVQAAHEHLAALAHLFGQRALQDAQPVAVAQQLVLGVHGRHGVLEIEDGGQRRLEHEVRHAGRVAQSDGRAAVDADVQVQAVVDQQHAARCGGLALVAHELRLVGEPARRPVLQRHTQLAVLHAISHRVDVRALLERHGAVQHMTRVLDDLGTTHRVVGLATIGTPGFRQGIGAIERVVQRTPAGVGRIQRVARVQDRHHQLRAGLPRQFGVDVGGAHLHLARRLAQVADFLEEVSVRLHVANRSRVRRVPAVDRSLQAVALGQQRSVLGRKLVHDGIKALPERAAGHARAGQHPVFDEAVERRCHLKAVDGGACSHVGSRCRKRSGRLSGTRREKGEASAPDAAAHGAGKNPSTSRRLVPMRVGAVSSCSSGRPARLTHSVV